MNNKRRLSKKRKESKLNQKGLSIPKQNKLVRRMTNFLYKKLSGTFEEHPRKIKEVEETPKDLEEVLPPRFLYPNNPNAPKVLVNYNPITRDLKKIEMVSQIAIHFQNDGDIILKDSDEHKVQEEIVEKRVKDLRKVMDTHKIGREIRTYSELEEYSEEKKNARKILRNKFNYCDFGVQSRLKVIRERGVSTSKPQLMNFSGEVNQFNIVDSYMDYCKKHKMERLVELGLIKNTSKQKIKKEENCIDSLFSQNECENENKSNKVNSFNRCLKWMERMIVQNNESKKYRDYKYIFTKENADISKLTDKTLYPLWRLVYAPNKKYNVTAIAWNTRYPDLFAASYGSYEFGKKFKNNVITLFSLKNISFPEKIIYLEDSAKCLDFHPSFPALLAVGLDNGNVMVYDIRTSCKNPIYKSSVRSKKHSDPVWQVKWSPDSQKQNFYSISSDGRVLNWLLMKDILECEEIYQLKFVDKKSKNQDTECSLTSLGCGLCFDFSPFDRFLFIVGTEEGNIHLCCTAYSGDYQMTYEGHQLAVYKVQFNPFDSEIFVSASADWTLKIWNTKIKAPLMTFELNQAIVDVQWSPFNSAVFIALSLEMNHVFDLRVNRHLPISEQNISKSKGMNLAINWKQPIIIIGDYHGGISTYKISDKVVDPNVDLEDNEFRQKQIQILKECIQLGSMID